MTVVKIPIPGGGFISTYISVELDHPSPDCEDIVERQCEKLEVLFATGIRKLILQVGCPVNEVTSD